MLNDVTLVSIVIPTRNSALQLHRCLLSLRDDANVPIEVIVVDQESDDGTPLAAAQLGARVLLCARPALYAPPTHSRNLGAMSALGDYLLHLDADMTLVPGALSDAVLACSDAGHVAMVLEELDITTGFWGECKALERKAYRGSDLIEGARLVRTDVFKAVGGYDEMLGSGEDWDIHARYADLGSIGRLPGAVCHHLGRVSYSEQLNKKFSYGRSSRAFLGKADSRNYSYAMVSAYGRSWRVFASDPVHAAGFVAMRFGEVAALGAGLAVDVVTDRLPFMRR